VDAHTVRVLIVESSDQVGSALCRWLDLQQGMCACGWIKSVLMMPDAIETMAPDVLLIDLAVGERGGLEVVGDLAIERVWPRVVVLTGCPMADEVYRAIEAGACGYVMRDDPLCELGKVIQRVASGEVAFSPGAMELLAAGMQKHLG
jgi:two-component system response regulator DesR